MKSGNCRPARMTLSAALAVIVLPPSLGCQPGSVFEVPPTAGPHEGYVFVTSATWQGNAFSMGKADEYCGDAAQRTILPNHVGTDLKRAVGWTAWVSYYDSEFASKNVGGAINRLKDRNSISLDTDPEIRWHATNWDGVSEQTVFPLRLKSAVQKPSIGSTGVHFDENGNDVLLTSSIHIAWTGTNSVGELNQSGHCLDVQFSSGGVFKYSRSWYTVAGEGVVGVLGSEDTTWVNRGKIEPCNGFAHLYCLGLLPR